MRLRYDPAEGETFKQAIQTIPGYPLGEDLPIRAMVFESGALLQLPRWLELAGARRERPLLVVMDRTPMRRAAADLKAVRRCSSVTGIRRGSRRLSRETSMLVCFLPSVVSRLTSASMRTCINAATTSNAFMRRKSRDGARYRHLALRRPGTRGFGPVELG